MARQVEFTSYEGSRTSIGQFVQIPWKSFGTALTEKGQYEVEAKCDSQLMIPAKFRDGARNKKLESVEYVGSMLPLDYDNITEDDYAFLLERLAEESLTYILYTTYGHWESQREKGTYKIRLILLLSRRVYKHEYGLLWEACNQLLGGLADPQCKDASHGFFLPTCPPGTPEEYRIAVFEEGKAIVVDELIQATRAEVLEHGSKFRRGGIPVEFKQVEAFAKKLKRRGTETGYLLVKMVEGLPFAKHGHRDEAVFKMCQDLAREFPEGEAGSIAACFSSSLSQMPGDHPITVQDVQEKLERAQSDVLAEKEAKFKSTVEGFKQIQENTAVPDDYDAEYIRQYAEETGSGSRIETFSKRLIICTSNSTYYVFFNKNYMLVPKDALYVVFRDFLYPARGTLRVNPHKVVDSGKEVPKTPSDLIADYGAYAENTEVRLGIERSFFEESTGTLVIAKCTQKITTPEYSEKVDFWMQKVVSTREELEGLRDWMAMCPDLTRPIAMLVMFGASNIGKTSFAEGIARLWSESYVEQSTIFEPFQDDLWKTPAVYADEEFPKDHKGKVPSARLRGFITARVHSINAKFMKRTETIGYYRLMAGLQTINKLEELSYKNQRQDINAIMQRLLVIGCRAEAGQYFDYDDFVKHGAIARHALWLRNQRHAEIVESKARFGIRNMPHSEYLAVALADSNTHATLDWMCQFLEQRLDEDSSEPPAFVARRELYFRWRGVEEMWDRLLGLRDRTKPDRRRLREALSTISSGETREIKIPSGKKRVYSQVNLEMLRAYAEMYYEDLDLERELSLYSLEMTKDGSGFTLRGDMYPTIWDIERREKALREVDLDLEPAAD